VELVGAIPKGRLQRGVGGVFFRRGDPVHQSGKGVAAECDEVEPHGQVWFGCVVASSLQHVRTVPVVFPDIISAAREPQAKSMSSLQGSAL
jgi:hypothetical protein